MKYPVYNQLGEKIKDVELNSEVFEVPVKEGLVHQVLVAQDANARIPVAHTKQRADVKGGGRKPWRQKGTGRARHGSIRSPIWKGGGVTFGPLKGRNFSKKINKKMKRKALFMTLSDKISNKHLVVVDDLQPAEVKTREFVVLMNSLFSKMELAKGKEPKDKSKFGVKTLIVTPESNEALIRSSKNIEKVKVVRADSLNIKDVLHYDWLVVPEKSLGVIEQTYLK